MAGKSCHIILPVVNMQLWLLWTPAVQLRSSMNIGLRQSRSGLSHDAMKIALERLILAQLSHPCLTPWNEAANRALPGAFRLAAHHRAAL
jgi:hypothetical protein